MSTSDPSFALSITHCPWIPARVDSMARLRGALDVVRDPSGLTLDCCPGGGDYRQESERAPWWVWSDTQWRWGAARDTTHVVFLQDDAIVPRGLFWPALRSMIAARPDDVVSLHCLHPAAMTLARQGVRWASTADGLVGLGYVFPTSRLREFLDWRVHHLRPGGAQELAEDSHINVWAVATGRPILHSIPTLIDHDTRIASTNVAQTAGRPAVVWTDGPIGGWVDADLARPAFWSGRVQHLGRQYAKTHWAARLVVPTFDRFYEVETDVCPPEYARLFVCA